MKKSLLLILMIAGAFLSCKKDRGTTANPVPYMTVNLTLNMSFPQYTKLNSPGGYVILDGEGYKGIIVIHDYNDQFHALDRSCPYHTNADCAKVTMEKAGLSLACGSYGTNGAFNACCASKYSLDGNVLNGPTTFPLRRYNVQVNDQLVVITN